MKYSFIAAIVLITSLTSCADPKYEETQNSPPGNLFQNQKVSECELIFSVSGYCILWEWEKNPVGREKGTLLFKVVRANLLDDSPVPVELPSVPKLVLWMPSMDHGSIPTQVEQVDAGSFRVTDVSFNMPGEWELKFQIKDGETLQDEAIFTLTR